MLIIQIIMSLINTKYGVDNFPKSSSNIAGKLGNLRIALLMANHINNTLLSMRVQDAFDDAKKELKDLMDKTPNIIFEQMGYELLEGSNKLDASGDRNYPPIINISRQIGKAIIAMECFIILKVKAQSTALAAVKKGDKKLQTLIATFEASSIKKNMYDF